MIIPSNHYNDDDDDLLDPHHQGDGGASEEPVHQHAGEIPHQPARLHHKAWMGGNIYNKRVFCSGSQNCIPGNLQHL